MFSKIPLLDKHSNKNIPWKHLYCRIIFTPQKRQKLNALLQIGFVFHTVALFQKLCVLKTLPFFIKEYPNGFRRPEFLDILCISDIE
jgi:hypothetical protein